MKCSTCKKQKSENDFNIKKNGKINTTCLNCLGKKKESRIKINFPENEIKFMDGIGLEQIEECSTHEEEHELFEDSFDRNRRLEKQNTKDDFFSIDNLIGDKPLTKEKGGRVKKEKQILTPEDNIKKLELKQKLQQYKTSFPKELSKVKINENSSIPELENKLEECRVTVSCNNTHNIVKFGYFTGVKGIEYMGSRFAGLKLQGLTESLKANEEVDRILKEIEIENLSLKYTSPTYRLAFITLTTVLGVDAQNKRNTVLSSFLNDKPKKEINDKYNDL